MSEDCAGRHRCEPKRYPVSLPDLWVCDECRMQHIAADMHDRFLNAPESATRSTMLRHLKPGTLGWIGTQRDVIQLRG